MNSTTDPKETPMILEAAHYEETRLQYMADPIIQQMAEEIPAKVVDDMTHDDGAPRFEFMTIANTIYAERGGKLTGHIGAAAEAITRLAGR